MYIVTIKKVKNQKTLSFEGKVYENLEDVMKYAKLVLKEMGSSRSFMFDGKGNIKTLKAYLDTNINENEYEDFAQECKDVMSYLHDIVLGQEPSLKKIKYEDGMVKASLKNEKFSLIGYDDGPYNGVVPCIETNFEAKEQTYYYFHIYDDFADFGDCDDISELYVDIVKTK